jgi:hypothetical protein
MARLKIDKNGIEAEADLKEIGEITFKTLPKLINNWLINRRNINIIKNTIKNIRILAFKPWKKYYKKFLVYENFKLPMNMEQIKIQSEYDIEHIHEIGHLKEFENRIAKEFAHFDILKKLQDENGGVNNFGVYLERTIKINGYTIFPFRKVYTYSKKGKAVFILEEFRPSDNTYNVFVYCTKNWI